MPPSATRPTDRGDVTEVDKKSFSDAMAIVYATLAADPKLQDLVAHIRADPDP